MPTILIILAVVFVIALWFVAIYNKLIKRRTLVEEAFSGMDIYLKKRYDLIPNLVETVKGYAKHEKETLDAVVTARNTAAAAGNAPVDQKVANENALSGAVTRLFAVAEQYPQLKADSHFLELQNQLNGLENDIAQSRKYYNGTVREYNMMTEVFPSSIVANMFGHGKYPFFEVGSDAERENVKVSF